MLDDWPNRAASRLVDSHGLEWHVQVAGTGPALLLLHGTGASTHSWRDSIPLLARHFRVVAPDLPGHGFTSTPDFSAFALPRMAQSLGALLRELEVSPAVAAGHSAGAAILVKMALDAQIAPRLLLGVNGAILPLTGFPHWLFSPLARLLARSGLIPQLVAVRAGNFAAVRRLIESTGSHLDEAGIRLYQRLLERPAHVAAALSMMANWQLEGLAGEIGRLRTPLKLLTGELDRTIPPAEAHRVCCVVAGAEVRSLGRFGHLAHEEAPQRFVDEVVRLSVQAGVLTSASRTRNHGELAWLKHHMPL